MVDWTTIETEYITGTASYRDLAEQYDVAAKNVSKYGKEHDWVRKRADYREKLSAKSVQKSVEKMSDVMSDITALQADSAMLIAKHIHRFLEEPIEEPMDLLRISNTWNIMQTGIRAGETAEEIASGICFLPERTKGGDASG